MWNLCRHASRHQLSVRVLNLGLGRHPLSVWCVPYVTWILKAQLPLVYFSWGAGLIEWDTCKDNIKHFNIRCRILFLMMMTQMICYTKLGF